MSRESFFTDVALSYRKLLSTPMGRFISLRDYCRTRHVAWRDFLLWSSTSSVASDLPGIKPAGKRTSKTKSLSRMPVVSGGQDTPLFYPLTFSNTDCDGTSFTGTPSLLRGIKITLPCGIRISIREGCGYEIARMIRLCNN